MANTLEYIFSLQDKVSAKIGNITVTSEKMLGKFADLEKKTVSVNRTFNETGRTLGSLREKIALLQAEREWIPAENIEGIRAYNREMKKLTKEITKLESLNGGKFKKWSKEAFAAIPGSNLISNPLVAGVAALGFSGKSAMNFDEGMAQVNITAQLDETGLDDLKTKLKKIAKDNKTDVLVAPVGFEKINSQLNDVDLSLSILDASLKGSKGGFTELDTVSGALAQTLSIVGKENASAQEVLDTFFAAKRVGAGEFADFARYMPNLIAGASNLGIGYKEVAGTFAYMTGKGQSAERAAVLMENAFSVLGRADVRGKMEKAGISVFDDTGKIRSVVDIFGDLQGILSQLNDEQKSSLLEKFGIVDKEAKNAFAVLSSDVDKLKGSMNDVANSSGETDKALQYSKNSMQKATEVWESFKNVGLEVGTFILPLINAGLDVASTVLSGLGYAVNLINGLFSWWWEQLATGNPLIWGITGAASALSAALLVNCVRMNAVLLATKAKLIWDGLQTGATWLLTTAQWALNAAFYASPLGWIALAIGAVTAAVVYCWNHFEGFRKFIMSMWETIKEFGRVLLDAIVSPFKQILKGLGGVGSALVSLVKGDFKEAATAAKEGFKDIGEGMLNASPVMVGANVVKNGNWSEAWEKGQQEGAKSWQASQNKKDEKNNGIDSLIPSAIQPETPAVNYDDLMKKLAKTKKAGSKGKKVINLNETSKTAQDYKETSDYTAVTKKLEPVKVHLSPVSQTMAKADTAGKVIDGRSRFAKADDSRQQYEPENENYLADIMRNVRKIAAVAAIPLAVNIAAPAQPAQANDKPAFTQLMQPDITADIPAPVMTVNVPPVQDKMQPVNKQKTPALTQPVPPIIATDIPAPVLTVNVPPVRDKMQPVNKQETPALTQPVPPVITTDIPAPVLAVNVPPVQDKMQPVNKQETPALTQPVPPAMTTDIPAPILAVNVPQVQEKIQPVNKQETPALTQPVPPIIATDIPAPVLTVNVSPVQDKMQPISKQETPALIQPVPPIITTDIPAPVLAVNVPPVQEKAKTVSNNPFSIQPEQSTEVPGIYIKEPVNTKKDGFQELADSVRNLSLLSEATPIASAFPVGQMGADMIQERGADYMNSLPQIKNDILIPEMAVPDTNVYNISNDKNERVNERTSIFSEKETVRDTGKTIQIDRVCDQIVIHVENTDKKGESEIRNAVIKVFNEIYEV